MTLTVPLPVYDQAASSRMQLRVFGGLPAIHNDEVIERILVIKGREAAKGLLLIASTATEFEVALRELKPKVRGKVIASWSGHVTWLLPGDAYPQRIKGKHSTVACRVPDHEQAREIAVTFSVLPSHPPL